MALDAHPSHRRRHARALHAARHRAGQAARAGVKFNRIAYSAAHVVADPLRRDRPLARVRDRLGRHDRLPPPPVVAGPGRRRGDGHRAARHGPRLADLARADPPLARRGEGRARRAGRLAAAAPTTSTPDDVKSVDDVIRAYEEQMEAIEALGGKLIVMASRALARVAQEPGRLRARVRPHPEPGAAAGDAALARRHVRPGARRLLGQRRTSTPRWTPRSASSPRIRTRSTASRSRCSTRTRKSRCAAACRRACACTPATTSTTPS